MMRFMFLKNTLLVGLAGIICLHLPSKAQNDSCKVEIYSNEVLSVKLLNSSYCPCTFFDGTGLVIFSEYQGNEFTKIIWGEASIDVDVCEFILVDMDKDGVNEVLTIFSFDTTFWGYIHKLEIVNFSVVNISSTEIPDSLSSKLDFLGEIEIVGDSSIVISGDPTDDNQRICITFDSIENSIIIK